MNPLQVKCYKVWYFDDDDKDEKIATAKDIRDECKDEVRGNDNLLLAYSYYPDRPSGAVLRIGDDVIFDQGDNNLSTASYLPPGSGSSNI